MLKSEREKNWWLGDGIDLANKAKAMGYQGTANPKKYDVILWLRGTREDAETEVAGSVAVPTPTGKPNLKRKAGEQVPKVSKRPAKGTKREKGWRVNTGLP